MIDHTPNPPGHRGRFDRGLDLPAEETAYAVKQARGGSPMTAAPDGALVSIIARQELRFPSPKR